MLHCRKPSAFFSIVLAIACISGSAAAQGFSHADSGWVRIFNGQDYSGLYSRRWGTANKITVPPDSNVYAILYRGTDTACLRVTGTTNVGGNLGTIKTSYSHYRVRVEQKFDELAPNNNAGLTYHTDETPARMSNNWPRSIEFQMQQREPGAAYSIQQCTFNTRVNGGNYAQTGGNAVTVCQYGCNGRNYGPSPTIPEAGPDGKPRWLRFELVTRGSDTAWHYINDTLVFKLWTIRIFNDAQNGTPNGPYDHGGFGLQSEGALIQYRRFEVMEFPPATPMNENFLHRLFLDHPRQEAVAPGAVYKIRWRAIGTIPKVSLSYAVGTGAWQPIATDIDNKGSYDWNVPDLTAGDVRVRVSGPEWAWADSATGTVSAGSPVARAAAKPPLRFFAGATGQTVEGIQDFTTAEIRDVAGRLIRSLPIGAADVVWDLSDGRGAKAQPGLYFVRLRGPEGSRTGRLFLF